MSKPSEYAQHLRRTERDTIVRHLREELKSFPWREQESLEELIEAIENGKYEGAAEEEPMGILLTSMSERRNIRRLCDDGSIPGDIVLELLTDIDTLLSRFVFPIQNEDDHRIALSEVERLWNSTLTPADAERLEVLAILVDDYESKVFPELSQQGHNEPCHVCGRRCDALAGDPGLWPLALVPPNGEPGVTKWHCSSCVHAAMRSAHVNQERLEQICNTAKLVEFGKASKSELWNVIDDARYDMDREKVEAHGGCPRCGDGRNGRHAKVRKPEFKDREGDGPSNWYMPCPRSPEGKEPKSVLDGMNAEERERLFKESAALDEVSGGPMIECETCHHGDPELDLFVCLPCAVARVHEEREMAVRWLRARAEMASHMDLRKRIEFLADCLERAEHRNDEKATPWPLPELMKQLVPAVEHLLADHACDAHGHEELREAARIARERYVGDRK